MKPAAIVSFLLLFFLGGCDSGNPTINGYIEADYVHYASSTSGILQTVAVTKGQQVEASALLFSLDNAKERQDYQQALSQLASENALLKDMQSGLRDAEIDVLHSQLNQAAAALSLAQSKARREQLQYQRKAIAEFEYEKAVSDLQQKKSAVDEIKKRIAANALPARQDRYDAQAARVAMAQASLEKNRWILSNTQRTALTRGRVADIYYRPGEWVPAGNPVIALLPPGNIKVRFFISVAQLAHIKYGQRIEIINANVPTFAARVIYISPAAEYTPPIIYSNERREKMTFLVEAQPEDSQFAAEKLPPGLPVEVKL
ncbi:HlyD family secretion protein [Kosakonia sacchari]|nr:HlyD family secretion protein [Kosakonia sacchari]